MKRFFNWLRKRRQNLFLPALALAIIFFSGCRKLDNSFTGQKDPAFYSSDVIDKWITLELRIYKDATGIGNGAFARPFAYSGISAYESTDPGLLSWKHKYNGLSPLPGTDQFKVYNWPASVNASLAEFNRSFFTTANLNATDLAAIDSLENAIYSTFSAEHPDVISRSVAFGK